MDNRIKYLDHLKTFFYGGENLVDKMSWDSPEDYDRVGQLLLQGDPDCFFRDRDSKNLYFAWGEEIVQTNLNFDVLESIEATLKQRSKSYKIWGYAHFPEGNINNIQFHYQLPQVQFHMSEEGIECIVSSKDEQCEKIFRELCLKISQEKWKEKFQIGEQEKHTLKWHTPQEENWKESVKVIQQDIERGDYKKLILAIRREFDFTGEDLSKDFHLQDEIGLKECYQYRIKQMNGKLLWGFSPEKVLSITKGWMELEAVAGTQREDQFDAKEFNEHYYVSHFLKLCAEKYLEEVTPDEVKSRKFGPFRHLYQRVAGQLETNELWKKVLLDSYPSPAAFGYPVKNVVLERIEELESFKRGIYAGQVFLLDKSYIFSVLAIRCVELEKNKGVAYAGAGITSLSDAEKEWEEVCFKSEFWNKVFLPQKEVTKIDTC